MGSQDQATWMCAVALLFAAGTAEAGTIELVTNGGFESPGLAPGAINRFLGNGDTYVTGWTAINDGIGEAPYLQTSPPYNVYAGNYSIFLNAGSGLSTTFATVAGETYELTVALLANHLPGLVPSPMGLHVAGIDTSLSVADDGLWHIATYKFTASSTNPASLLRFQVAQKADFNGYLIDSVSVTAVPLPSAAWMGIGTLGLLGLALNVRRRRRAAIA